MVSKNSIYYGQLDGIKAPVVPRARRSLRVIDEPRTSSEGSKLSAFELLADVASKLLQESESSTSSIGQEWKGEINVKKEEPEVNVNVKESPESDYDSGLEHVSDIVKKVGSSVKLEPFEGKNVDKLELVQKDSGELAYRDSCVNTRVLNKPFSSVHLPFYNYPVCKGNIKMGIRDDDDKKPFRRNYSVTKMRSFKSQSRAGYRRIRKMLTSRYHKLTTKKDYEVVNPTNCGMKLPDQYRKNIYNQERCQIEAASKKRKLFYHNSSDTSKKVKFSIKSFKVPGLYVEIPETATIGSLKRTVMEALSAYLGGELHVGVLLEGKKVRDNNWTLQQTGISQSCNLESLGFTLEPGVPQLLQPQHTSQQPSSSTASPITDVGCSNCSLDLALTNSLENHVDKNQEIIPLQTEVLTEERVADFKAVAPITTLKVEPLSAVPFDNKPTNKSEGSQRRIRRPFSVLEVEALVEAVETIGTGRWHDVKLNVFNDATHRTSVDLKDKWKTLVHTASIAPQQRRGQLLPQVLLDRVLAAHGYWANHQHKRQQKGPE
uniref:telomere repeat-binding protein 3-like n=1 Tax=Erigeron canadensis TaxID=72917 RepID=UPI001CB92493|nr:telomere repeat-binding protein 3-like [Erigeron canadensis]